MIANIDFCRVSSASNCLENVDVGNCAIEAFNQNGYYYYLVIHTIRGQTYIASCGPFIPDIQELENGFNTSLTITKFSDKKLKKNIYAWLNDYEKGIIEATLVDKIDALSQFKDLSKYMLSIVGENDE